MFSQAALAQKAKPSRVKPLNDSSYYSTYEKFLVAGPFLASKYTRLILIGSASSPNLRYTPNVPLNIGISATYNFITLNLAAGLRVLNSNAGLSTHYLDLQSHIYIRKISVDLYGQFYKGYYIPSSIVSDSRGNNYIRPDVQVNFLGSAFYYIVNFRKFSYRASMNQDEWQKKSAGSFLIGGEIYYGGIHGDSSLVPSLLKGYSSEHVRKLHFFELGPGVGYVYTFVWKQHYFLTGGANFTASSVYKQEFGDSTGSKLGIAPNFTYRAAAGYNGQNWALHVSWVNNQTNLGGVFPSEAYHLKIGYYQLSYEHRFNLHPRIKKKMTQVTDKMKSLMPEIH
jgi:hypothetical protein